MNTDILKGQWNQLKGQLKQQWGKLTNDDLDSIEGSRDILIGKLQERYGRTRDEAEREIDLWLDSHRVNV
ncbi:MAG TPA: CsbD family protein [Vicinamibacteria bacterium]